MEREFNSKVVPTSLNESIIKFLEKYMRHMSGLPYMGGGGGGGGGCKVVT